ncbi:MAG: 4a-hydroxytetrahydrobiopterin dehydratase [Proteobacteria bacterium]|nr:4a-hydroxytetrahydrobiopterin dehydratase [Pseudomonadota bacterium]
MGKLINGKWAYRLWTTDASGEFKRSESVFRGQIQKSGPHPPQAGRYHLYVSYACPWAHRTLIARRLLGLEDVVSAQVVDPYMTQEGWHFSTRDGCGADEVNHADFLRDIYRVANPDVTCRVTVPVLWDRETRTIVNNESREIVRMFDRVLAPAFGAPASLTPAKLEAEVDALTARFYNSVNNGVYRCGFATSQAAYTRAFTSLFAELDQLERELEGKQWLVGGQLTEADLFLFTTLFRFDAVYFGHFKCNRRAIRDYPNLYAHTQRVYAVPGVAETCHLDHIIEHYYRSHESINPKRIIPGGPRDFFPVNTVQQGALPVAGHAEPPFPAPPEATRLSAEQVGEHLKGRTRWRLEEDHLVCDLDFASFGDAMAYLTHVADKAEAFNHHPDIHNSYSRVTLRLRTHDADAITALDFALVDALDGIRQ